MANRSHRLSPFGKSPARITRLRIRMFAQMIRTVCVIMFGLCAGWMVMTLAFSWSLALGAVIGLALFLLGYGLVPLYAEAEAGMDLSLGQIVLVRQRLSQILRGERG